MDMSQEGLRQVGLEDTVVLISQPNAEAGRAAFGRLVGACALRIVALQVKSLELVVVMVLAAGSKALKALKASAVSSLEPHSQKGHTQVAHTFLAADVDIVVEAVEVEAALVASPFH